MAGPRPIEPKTDKKALDQTVAIPLQEFLRTRDSVVSGLNTLVGVIHELNNAYVKHTGDLLTAAGVSPEVLTQYALNYMTLPAKPSLLTAGIAMNPDGKVRKKRVKKEKDPNAPKRPLTAYFLYSTFTRSTVKEEMPPETTPVEINSEILRRWKALPEEEKQTWKDRYEENNKKYQIVNAEYKKKTGEAAGGADDETDDDDDDDADAGAKAPAAVAVAADDDDEDEDDEEEEEPAKPPTPPPTKVKKAKATKAKAKENGAGPSRASPSPSAQLRATAEAGPSSSKKTDKKRKSDKDAEEPKKKKSKAEEKEVASPVATKDKEKKKKRKSEA